MQSKEIFDSLIQDYENGDIELGQLLLLALEVALTNPKNQEHLENIQNKTYNDNTSVTE